MRILFILDRLSLGGAELHTMTLASKLAGNGHEVETVVLLSGGSAHFPLEAFPAPPRILGGHGLASPRMLRDLSSEITRFKPDAVFAINQSALVAATFVRRFGARMPWLACIFHTTVIASRLGRLRIKLFQWCTARADALVFVSSRQRDYWLSRGMRSKRVEAVPNGTDSIRFDLPDPQVRADLRQRYGLADTDVAVVLVARFAPEKNHIALLRALAEMRSEGAAEAARLRPVFIGDGPLRSTLEVQVEALGLSGQVIFAGAHRDVAPLLALGDLGILVSNSIETFSLAALELMASGLPMIMTDTGGAAEILGYDDEGDERCGLLIPVGDTAALRNALTEMAKPSRRVELGAASRRRVSEHFTLEHMTARYEALLVDVAGQGGR